MSAYPAVSPEAILTLFRQPDVSEEKFLEGGKWVEKGFDDSERPTGEMSAQEVLR